MKKQHKLAEARYFISRLNSLSDPQSFSFELSAFLSAARSVLQYVLEEAKAKPSGQKWYSDLVLQFSPIKYFKSKRDINIHVEPVLPNRHVGVELVVPVCISESLSLKLMDQAGNVIDERAVNSPVPSVASQSTSTVSVSYRFADWAGTENVQTLCQQYLNAIEAVIQDGRAKALIA